MKKKLYYTNRLQLTSSSHIQHVYAYSMIEKNLNRWVLYFVTDHKYKPMDEIFREHWFNYKAKIHTLIKIGKAIAELHRHNETYGCLTLKNILIDSQKNIYLNSFITKDIPPYVSFVLSQTDPFEYDLRQYLLLIYQMFT